MPIYEYLCGECGERFAKLQKMSATPDETACPKCGSRDVARQISACAVGGASAGSPAGGFSGG